MNDKSFFFFLSKSRNVKEKSLKCEREKQGTTIVSRAPAAAVDVTSLQFTVSEEECEEEGGGRG